MYPEVSVHVFQLKCVYAFLFHMHAAWPACFFLLDLIISVTLTNEYFYLVVLVIVLNGGRRETGMCDL
jgi:hypothetical protein